ncbi:endonuclease/exonuclease/phosphatase family protein [Myxococcota bacterium]|nr:endonuclease/exonuclease/phosphatase family protein [Myxococcota bacterium]
MPPEGIRVLEGPLPPPDPLPREVLDAFGAIRRRSALERSPLWTRWQDEVTARTSALVHGLPRVPGPRPPVSFLRVATWNVQRGLRLEALVDTLRDHPDLRDLDALMLNEVDLGMARSRNRDVAAEVADSLGMSHVFGNSYLCLDAGDPVDRLRGDAGPNTHAMHGNAILSRWPLRRACNVPVFVTKDKFHSGEKRLGAKRALWAEVETPLGPVVLASAHLDSVASSRQRAAQLRDLVASLPEGLPVVLGGDLNTHTYDVSSTGGLLRNLWQKLVRGGFPHAIHHYMHPWEIYETPVFRVLEEAGFRWRECNDLSRGTLRYEVGTFESESAIREHLPEFAVWVLRWRLRPWNGVAPLRMDWMAVRDLRPLGDGEAADPGGRHSRGPRVVERPLWQGNRISDHDPLVLDVSP